MNHRPLKLRFAFTLVELLVVIAIIGVLISLLLPAVQAAREAARRCSCSNNLMQIGLGLHHHEFTMERLPSGVTDSTGPIRHEPIGRHVGWITDLLPYIEQNNLYDHLDLSTSIYSANNNNLRAIRINLLICPSSPDTEGAVAGSKRVGISNYAGCHNDTESPIDTDNNGVLYLNSRLPFAKIRDGLSQTIMVGEVSPIPENLGWGSGTRSTLRNTSSIRTSNQMMLNANANASIQDARLVGGFGSFHSGGAQFSLADGSVHFLSQTIDPDVLRRLGHRADGEPMDGVY